MNTSTDFAPTPDSFKWLLSEAKDGSTYSDTGASETLSDLLEQVAAAPDNSPEQAALVTATRAQYRAELARSKADLG